MQKKDGAKNANTLMFIFILYFFIVRKVGFKMEAPAHLKEQRYKIEARKDHYSLSLFYSKDHNRGGNTVIDERAMTILLSDEKGGLRYSIVFEPRKGKSLTIKKDVDPDAKMSYYDVTADLLESNILRFAKSVYIAESYGDSGKADIAGIKSMYDEICYFILQQDDVLNMEFIETMRRVLN